MRFKSGGIELEKGRVRVRRVAISMFAIRRAPTRDDRLILEKVLSLYRIFFWPGSRKISFVLNTSFYFCFPFFW